jgi:hypothetical protein
MYRYDITYSDVRLLSPENVSLDMDVIELLYSGLCISWYFSKKDAHAVMFNYSDDIKASPENAPLAIDVMALL